MVFKKIFIIYPIFNNFYNLIKKTIIITCWTTTCRNSSKQ